MCGKVKAQVHFTRKGRRIFTIKDTHSSKQSQSATGPYGNMLVQISDKQVQHLQPLNSVNQSFWVSNQNPSDEAQKEETVIV